MKFDHYSLRLLSLEDLDPYFQLVQRNRERLADFFVGTVARTKTYKEAQDFVEEMIRMTISNTYYPYLIIDDSDKSIIGFIDLKNIDWTIPKAEIGFYIDEPYAGKGIITKALQKICEHCFEEMGFQKLFLRTHPENVSAQRVAEKCGFELEGRIRKDYKTTSGVLIDLNYYGRLS